MDAEAEALQSAQEKVLHVDMDLRITWVDDNFTSDSNGDRNDAVGRYCYDYRFQQDKPCDGCPVIESFRSGLPARAEVHLNEYKWFEESYPVPVPDGEMMKAVVVIHDNSGYADLEQKLKDSESIKSVLYKQGAHAILIIDPETLTSREFNDAAVSLFGYSRDELGEVSLLDLYADKDSGPLKTKIEKAMNNEPARFKTICRTKNGFPFNCFLDLRRVELSGKPYVLTIIQDITQQHQADLRLSKSEYQLRSIVENSPDIIMEIDLQGRILYANRILKGFAGGVVVGTNLLHYMPRYYHRRIRQAMHKCLTKRQNSAYETSLVTTEGERWWNTRVIPMENDGRISSFLLITTDITQNRRFEAALKESEERFRGLVENSPIPVVVHIKGIIDYVNSAAMKLVKASGEMEILGRSIFEYIHPDDHQRVMDSIRALGEKDGQATRMEIKMHTHDRQIVDVVASGVSIKYKGGRANIVILNDVTERNRAEEALKASEKKYRYLTENMRDAVWMMDFNWQHLYVSPSIESIRGFTPKEIFELPIEKSLPPKSLEQAQRLLAEGFAHNGLDEKGGPYTVTFEQEEYCKDGGTVWTEVRASFVLDENKQPVAMIGCTREITDRKKAEDALRESEERYRSLVENSPIPMFIYREREAVFVNQSMVELMGAENREQLIGLSIIEYAHKDDQGRLMENIKKYQESGIIVHDTYRMNNLKGREILIRITGIDVVYEGLPARMVFIVEENTNDVK